MNIEPQEQQNCELTPLAILPPSLQYSPVDGSFVPLSLGGTANLGQIDPKGYEPPCGAFVEFALVKEPNVLIRGMTGQLSIMGPWEKHQTAFIVSEQDREQVYFYHEVSKW